MPKLNPIFRGILYVSMLVFGALAITNVFFECFSFYIGIVIYIFAAAMYAFYKIIKGEKTSFSIVIYY